MFVTSLTIQEEITNGQRFKNTHHRKEYYILSHKLITFSLCSPGNVFVIAAIIIERNLQNVANYLVASLAVADLMVACLVMPLGAVYEVRQCFTISVKTHYAEGTRPKFGMITPAMLLQLLTTHYAEITLRYSVQPNFGRALVQRQSIV